MKIPTVFLSLSGKDENFVSRVHEYLPDGLAYFYPRSFATGENLISAMQARVGEASMFVFFASRASLISHWVGFELDQAHLSRIKNPRLQILVFLIDPNLSSDDLPVWMRDYWVGSVGHGPRDIARYVRRTVNSRLLGDLPGNEVYGRGTLTDKARAEIADVVFHTGETPNVLVLGGNAGIGRRTFGRRMLAEAFPATPDLNVGPEFQLPQFADVADLYRALRQEIETSLSFTAMGDDIRAFGGGSDQCSGAGDSTTAVTLW